MKFKVGDKVRCIRISVTTVNLILNKVYTISRSDSYAGMLYCSLKEHEMGQGHFWWYQSRFVLVQEEYSPFSQWERSNVF